jgi:replicative DNA helicase
VAQYLAVEHKKPVAIFSLEMAFRQIILRMLCADAMVDASSIRRGFVKHNFHKLATAAGKLIDTRIFVDDTSGISSLEMRAKARRLKREHPDIGLVVVDYLQLMKGSGNYEQRVQEISEISRSLKALAKEIDVPVMALSQLNRAVERERRRPNMSDLRESGAIEQDADVIIFLYRDEKPKNPSEDKRPSAEVINVDIAKQRNGPTGSLQLTFLPRFTRFMDYTPEDFSYAEEEAF